MGRINYGLHIMEERKGLSGALMLGGKELGPFEHISLPMQTHPNEGFTKMDDEEKSEDGSEGVEDGKSSKATYFRGKIRVNEPVDTWLDIRGFGRGIVWFNGHNLGRYWNAGPPQTVFVPACWMKKGEDNELIVLELEAERIPREIPTVSRQIWGSSP
jgi:beta-galactosidase